MKRTQTSRNPLTHWSLALALLAAAGLAAPAWATGLNGDEAYSEGPIVCGECHEEELNDWLTHGHSRKVANHTFDVTMTKHETPGEFGTTAAEPRFEGFPLPPHDPDVYNWDNVLFVIGASKYWKTRFVGLDGYFLTKGGRNQYNWATGEWVDYNADVEMKPFDCGTCHTTGYRGPDDDPPGDAFSEDYPGIVGDFAHLNVTCEACHGPGAAHAMAPSDDNIEIDDSAELCGTCHTRGDDDMVAIASGSFIRHHEQFPELLNGPHSFLDCTSCHDAHVGRARGIDVPDGATETCIRCHPGQTAEYEGSSMQAAGVKCQDCHMGRATRSARNAGPYEGDVWTHLFAIDSSADYDMFNRDEDGNATSAKGALSLEYACFRCHADADKAAYAAIGDEGSAYHTLGASE